MSNIISFPRPAPLSSDASALIGAVGEIDAVVVAMMARGVPPMTIGLALCMAEAINARADGLPLDALRDEADSMVAEVSA